MGGKLDILQLRLRLVVLFRGQVFVGLLELDRSVSGVGSGHLQFIGPFYRKLLPNQ